MIVYKRATYLLVLKRINKAIKSRDGLNLKVDLFGPKNTVIVTHASTSEEACKVEKEAIVVVSNS